MKNKISFSKGFFYTLLIIGAFVMILPFYWSIKTSFESLSQSLSVPPKLGVNKINLENYSYVWNNLSFGKFFSNTIIMVFFRVILSTIFSAMAGYAITRIKFPGVNLIFMIILIPMMIPGQIYSLPQYLLMSKMGLLNTTTALVLPGVASTFGTFLMRQFFMGIPEEIEEASVLDGASKWDIFTKVMLPLAKAPMISLAIFTGLGAWKDLMWPLIVNSDAEKLPISAGLALLQGQYTTNYPQLMAGSLISTIPMIILYVIFQKQFIQGVSSSGGK